MKTVERDHVAVLIGNVYQADDLRQQIPTEVRREVFCTVGSIQQSEFFAAGRSGLKAKLRVRVFAEDYLGEDTVEVDGVRYGIYRTYLDGHDRMELYLERKGGA